MPVDYTKTSNYPGGIVNETLLFGKVDVTNAERKNFTNNVSTYTTDPKTWAPDMRNRYLLASFSDELKKGSSYDVTLRIVRPTLPIERLWAYREGNAMQQKKRTEAEGIAEGTQTDNNYYPSLNSKLYRLPKYSEFIPIFNNPKVQLNRNQQLGNGHPSYIGKEYGYAIPSNSHGDYVDINGQQRKFSNWFCTEQGNRVMYAIMYFKAFGGIDANGTNNYKVAVRMTFPTPEATSGEIKVETYYLGPNYNLSMNVAGYYMCHDEFWKRLSKDDIIVRTFQLGTYWLNTKNATNPYEKKSQYNDLSPNGVTQNANSTRNKFIKHYFIPWLKSPAW